MDPMHFGSVIVYPDPSFSDNMTTDTVWDGTVVSRANPRKKPLGGSSQLISG